MLQKIKHLSKSIISKEIKLNKIKINSKTKNDNEAKDKTTIFIWKRLTNEKLYYNAPNSN